MASFGLIIFFLSTFVINFSLITVQSAVDTDQPIYVSHYCFGGNYAANSTYDTNLNVLLSSLSSNGNVNPICTNGFYYSTAGRNTDTVYGALQCRGDVTFQECRTCVDTATQEIRKEDKCPVSKQAIIWYHTCMLRYSNESFLSIMQEDPSVYLWNSDIITNNTFRFNQIANGLLSDLATEATSPSSVSSSNNTLFATGVRNFTNTEKVYGLVQCTSDLNSSSCDMCLGKMINQQQTCCNDKQGGRVITPSCNFRYEIYIFFRERVNDSLPLAPSSPPKEQPRLPAPSSPPEEQPRLPPSSPPEEQPRLPAPSSPPEEQPRLPAPSSPPEEQPRLPPSSPPEEQPRLPASTNTTTSSNGTITKKKTRKIYMVVIHVAASVLVIAIIIAIASSICLLRRKAAREKADRGIMQTSDVHLEGDSSSSSKYYKHNEEGNGVDVPFIDFETILTVTDNFSNSNKLGQGGFGPVYKGTFKGGQEMAVKRLSRSSGQGLEEFRNEVLLIAKLQHRNLVKLLGYCIKEEEKILLYEYMPNKSLDIFIFDRTLCLLINWEKRLDIILGIARGILYLHRDSRLRIIHRDLKTSNILLDEEMNPKISDFGLARICGETQTEGCTNRVVGTYGYMAPEYALDGLFSVKSDVYSFGVVLLEIISGKKNSDFHGSEGSSSFIGYAWRLWNENKVLDFIDDSLYEACNAGEALKCIQVGLLCVQEVANDRPTMSSVVFMLDSETTSIPTPKQPELVFRRYLSSTTTSSSRPESCLRNQITEEGR